MNAIALDATKAFYAGWRRRRRQFEAAQKIGAERSACRARIALGLKAAGRFLLWPEVVEPTRAR
jgi:hypothetical protein